MATVNGNRNDQEQSHIKKVEDNRFKKAGYPFSSRSMAVSDAKKRVLPRCIHRIAKHVSNFYLAK